MKYLLATAAVLASMVSTAEAYYHGKGAYGENLFTASGQSKEAWNLGCPHNANRDPFTAQCFKSGQKHTAHGQTFSLTRLNGEKGAEYGDSAAKVITNHDRWSTFTVREGNRRTKHEFSIDQNGDRYYAPNRKRLDRITDGTKTLRYGFEFKAKRSGWLAQIKAPGPTRSVPAFFQFKDEGVLVVFRTLGKGNKGGGRLDKSSKFANPKLHKFVLAQGKLVEGKEYKLLFTNKISREKDGIINFKIVDIDTGIVQDEYNYVGQSWTDEAISNIAFRVGLYTGSLNGEVNLEIRNFHATIFKNGDLSWYDTNTRLTDGTIVSNGGTGIASDNRTSNLTWGGDNSNKDRLLNSFRDIHSEGFRGQGTTIIVGNDLPTYFDTLADEARVLKIEGYTDAVVKKGLSRVLIGDKVVQDETTHSLGYITGLTTGFGNKEARSNAIIAAGTSVLWSKFDNLNASQVEDLVMSTSVDGLFRLDRAMSPAGNLR